MDVGDELSLARPLADDLRCEREYLRLPDGHAAPVLHHFPPEPSGKPPVVYFHGIQSHPGWFVGSAEALARSGREVFQVTRRGSGSALTRRGDASSAAQLLDDTAAAVEQVRAQCGAEAAALVGVSWGGKLLTAYALSRGGEGAASLTLVAPGICPQVDVPARAKAAIALASFLWPWKRFDIPLSDVALFTDNPPMRRYLEADRLRLHRATGRMLVASALLDRTIARAARGSLDVPVTLILAGRDRIIDNARTRSAIDRLTAGRARIVEFDAAHTIEFEPDPREFHRALCAVVDAPGGAGAAHDAGRE